MLTFLNRVAVVVVAGVVAAAIRWAVPAGRRRWEWQLREKYSLWKHRNARFHVYGFAQHGNRSLFDHDNPVARAAYKLGLRARWQKLRSEFPDLFGNLPPDSGDGGSERRAGGGR